MDSHQKEVFGAWIQAIGTVIGAIGSTPTLVAESDTKDNLNLLGNVMQATGNALIAEAQEIYTLDTLGNEVQAIGNVTVVAGMMLDVEEITSKQLIIKGNLLQAVGGGASLADALANRESKGLSSDIVGNYLQIIGNSLQAIGGMKELDETPKQERSKKEVKPEKWDSYDVNGSWIQAVGSVISAIGQSKPQADLNETSNEET